MKNKMSKSESVFKKKGFYVALYSCIGVVLVLAAAISFANFNSDKTDEMQIAEGQVNPGGANVAPPDTESAMKSMTPEGSYLIPGDTPRTTANATGGSSDLAKKAQIEEAQPEEPKEETESKVEGKADSKEKNPEKDADTSKENEEASGSEDTNKQENPKDADDSQSKTSDAEEAQDIDVTVNRLADPVFQTYDGESDMEWPVFGEVVMDYSEQSNVYDVTLEQYRTNDNICIEAQIGAQVKASAEGVVKYVGTTRENGNVLVIDHGNGWETTYSQLQDNILVQEGDVVSKGQVVGGVGSPSIYSVLLGSHLNFKVTCADESVNPLNLLVENAD